MAVDLQNDFASEGGKYHSKRPSVAFVLGTLVPELRGRDIKIAEIVSDYRQPRPGDARDCCRPGEWGYESVLPGDARLSPPWVKSMNLPLWTRDGAGDARATPGLPRADLAGFSDWLLRSCGDAPVVLFGLTLDRCVLATALALNHFGREVFILEEGTDTASGDAREKERVLESPPLTYWAKPISWEELSTRLRPNRT